MIPPTSIDGTDITGATIDGTDVQEITVDGDVVFTAAPTIPSGATHFYALDEGTGSVGNDSVGTLDGTITNPIWQTDSTFFGGAYLENQGSSVLNIPQQLPFNTDFTIAFTFTPSQGTPSDDSTYWQWSNSSDKLIGVVQDGSDILAHWYDGSNFQSGPTIAYPSGNEVRIWVYWDSTNQDLELRVNDNPSTGTGSDDNLGGGSSLVMMDRDTNLPDRPLPGGYDAFTIYDGIRKDPTDDYNAQPWS